MDERRLINLEQLTAGSKREQLSGSVSTDTYPYKWANGSLVETGDGADSTAITVGNLDQLSPESLANLQEVYKQALESSVYPASHELWRGVQTRIFAVADRLNVSDTGIDVYISDDTLPAPYNRDFAARLLGGEISQPTVGERRQQPFTGEGVLLSGGVNNFVVVRDDDGLFKIKLLTLTRNVISNDGVTTLADAGMAQSPGGGRLENAVAYPELAIDETKEETHTQPALDLGRAMTELPMLNPQCIRVFVSGEEEPVAQFYAKPFVDEDSNTVEAYANALHFVGGLELAVDKHQPDQATLSDGRKLYRGNDAALVDLAGLEELATRQAINLTPDGEGVLDASVVDSLEEGTDYMLDDDGNYALLRPLGLTPQLANLVADVDLMKWLRDLEYTMNTPDGETWTQRQVAQYSQVEP